MKKLITILAIMIVLVGAAFAAPAANDSAQITVNAEIKIQYPVYSLQATSSSFSKEIAGASVTLGSAANVLANQGTSTVTISDDVMTQANTTVEFTINQTTLSRIKGTYTLGVTATDLIITAITKADGTKSTAAADLDTTNNRFTVSAAPTITKGSNGTDPTNTTMTNTTAGSLAIAYNGKKVAEDTVIGKFSYTWNKNEDAAAGDYQATVTLTITSIQ